MVLRFNEVCEFPPTLLDDPSTRPDGLKEEFLKLKNTSFIPPMDVYDYFPRPTPNEPCKLKEAKVMINVTKYYVLLPLFGAVEFEYSIDRKAAKVLQGARSRHIGIGSEKTLHATPDMRVMCTDMVCTPIDLDDSDDKSDEDDESDEDITTSQHVETSPHTL